MRDQDRVELPDRMPAVLADELIEALRSCRRISGVSGDALIDMLQRYRGGGFYIQERVPAGRQAGLSPRLDAVPIRAALYIALRDLDRAYAKVHALRAGGVAAWAFKPLAEYPEFVRFVRAANKGLPTARRRSAEKRSKEREQLDAAMRRAALDYKDANPTARTPDIAEYIRDHILPRWGVKLARSSIERRIRGYKRIAVRTHIRKTQKNS